MNRSDHRADGRPRVRRVRAAVCVAILILQIGSLGCVSSLASGKVEWKTSLILLGPEVGAGAAYGVYRWARCKLFPDSERKRLGTQAVAEQAADGQPGAVTNRRPHWCERLSTAVTRALYATFATDILAAIGVVTFRTLMYVEEREQARREQPL